MRVRVRKWWPAFGILAVILMAGCEYVPFLGSDRPRTIDQFMRIGKRTRVIAHRGFSGVAPENTMIAFEKAIELGADMIELDVLLSRDGEVIVIHDDTLERTAGKIGDVSDFTLAELNELEAGSWFSEEFAGEKIPTLGEVLDLVKGNILLNIEIKSGAVTEEVRGGIAEKVIELVNARNMRDGIIISSFSPRALKHAHEVDPSIRTATLYNKDRQEGMTPMAIMEDAGSTAFNLSRDDVTLAIIGECHANGRPVSVYTVNETAEMKRLIEMGVDAIFTDRPDLMMGILD